MPSRFDPYYDPYSSDASSQDARSGSATPIVDKEARFYCFLKKCFPTQLYKKILQKALDVLGLLRPPLELFSKELP